MLSVGIIGASGYLGKNLIRFCNQHPFIENFEVYGNSTAENFIGDIFPDFDGIIENKQIINIHNLSYSHDIYFLALPHGEAVKLVPSLIDSGKKVIDLSGDFRLDSAEKYIECYRLKHSAASLLENKIYGLADVYNEKYDNTNLIANPGCYPTAALLSLLPLIKSRSGKISSISIVAYSGTSGAGKSPKTELLLSEMDGNAKAYNVHTHRHEPEILQELEKHGFNSDFSFTTHLLPIDVGIYSTANVFLSEEADENNVLEFYNDFYSTSSFVRLRNSPPQLKWVVGTNFCDINISVRRNSIIITATIDNLIKGGAGQAIQNLNKLFGWDETTGILNIRGKNVQVY